MATERMIEDPSARRVVNALEGTTNIIDTHVQRSALIAALEMCLSSLEKHSGPTSGYAMLVNANAITTDFDPNIYTRDGIQTLSAIEFLSPLENHMKQVITYVGSRVDAVAKDGTTTSMIFVAKLLAVLLQQSAEWQDIKLASPKIVSLVNRYFDLFMEQLSHYKLTVDDLVTDTTKQASEAELMEYGGLVAFMQAMSSSGGNIELANAMYQIFSKSPKITWDRISYYNTIKETDQPFAVEVDAFDMRFRCILAGDNILTKALGTEYDEEDVDIFCYPDAVSDFAMKTDNILHFLTDYPDERPLLFVALTVPGAIVTQVRDLNQSRKYPISLWQYSPEDRIAGQQYPWELLIFCAIAGITPYCLPSVATTEVIDARYVMRAKRAHYHDTYLDVYGIVDMPESSCLHPYYADRSTATPFYLEMVTALEKQLTQYRDGNKKDGVLYGIFVSMLNRLVAVHRPTLRLGGTIHEQLANISVVEDVQGATMSSLNHGFSVVGPLGLHFAYLDTVEHIHTFGFMEELTDAECVCVALIMTAVRTAVTTVCKSVYDDSMLTNDRPAANDQYFNVLADTASTTSTLRQYLPMLQTYVHGEDLLPQQLNYIKDNYPVMHPFRTYEELFKRVKELGIRQALTNEIIVGGGVVMKKDTTDGHHQS